MVWDADDRQEKQDPMPPNPCRLVSVGVWPAVALTEQKRLLAVLEDIFPIRFLVADPACAADCDALMCLGARPVLVESALRQNRNCLVIATEASPIETVEQFTVHFSDSEVLPALLRGRQFLQEGVMQMRRLAPSPGDETLASVNGQPIWVTHPSKQGLLHRLAVLPPVLHDRSQISDLMRCERFLELLPLLCFLRAACLKAGWHFPPPRAVFMLDDPNLHWWSYGCVDFRQLLHEAQRHHYHVAVPTIPFDHWFIHSGVAKLFRENPQHLSLLVHGSSHVGAELLAPRTLDEALAILAQGLRKISRLEQRTGLHVARSIVPPQEKCSVTSTSAMVRLGIESCCSGAASFRHFAPGAYPPGFGLSSATFLGEGCPVFERIPLCLDREIPLVRAWLTGQPLIPVVHHAGLKDLGVLAALAAKINLSGGVEWMDMTRMVRSQFFWCLDGGILSILKHSRLVELPLPGEVRQLKVLRPWLADQDTAPLQITLGEQSWNMEAGAIASLDSIAGQGGQILSILSPSPRAVACASVPSPSFSPWAIVRRVLCEGRDRAKGVAYRMKGAPVGTTGGPVST